MDLGKYYRFNSYSFYNYETATWDPLPAVGHWGKVQLIEILDKVKGHPSAIWVIVRDMSGREHRLPSIDLWWWHDDYDRQLREMRPIFND